jgi:hypothetical protein
MECHSHEKGVSPQVCNNPANYLPTRYFSIRIGIILNLTNKGKKINQCFIMLTQMSIEVT